MTGGEDAGLPPSWTVRNGRRLVRHLGVLVAFSLPAIVLWWHVWTGHPTSTLTCACGDPAQEVWFMAWPAWALTHWHSVFFSGAVNVPYGANLLSNTSGTLVGVVLSPVTWLWGPVASTNVALTLAPALSAWGCWVALRRFVTWKPAAVPAALIYGYSSAILSSLIFGHISVTMLPLPPLLLACLYDIVIRQGRNPWRHGLELATLVVLQFLLSPEILVMCGLLAVVALVLVLVVQRRAVATHLPYALRVLGIGLGLAVILLAYPAWFGVAGPESVSGVLFAIAPLSGVLITGFLSPGAYHAAAGAYERFGGYLGRVGPPPDYLGWGIAASTVGSLALLRRRPLPWLLFAVGLVGAVLSLGPYLIGGTLVISHVWLPWRALGRLPLLNEILPDQLAPFATLFLAFIIALGLSDVHRRVSEVAGWSSIRRRGLTALVTVVVVGAMLVPVFATFNLPLTVHPTQIPQYMATVAPRLPDRPVLLTVPFAMSGSAAPMLWQAEDDMHFELAGGALKTPNATGGPVNQGSPGSTRRLLADLTLFGSAEPRGTERQLHQVRQAIAQWHVTEVVIDGPSRDPMYASGFLTAALGTMPTYTHFAWVWHIASSGRLSKPVLGANLAACRGADSDHAGEVHPLATASCVLAAAST